MSFVYVPLKGLVPQNILPWQQILWRFISNSETQSTCFYLWARLHPLPLKLVWIQPQNHSHLSNNRYNQIIVTYVHFCSFLIIVTHMHILVIFNNRYTCNKSYTCHFLIAWKLLQFITNQIIQQVVNNAKKFFHFC